MKFIQSCWACNRPNLLESDFGWYAPEYNLMSWALSCMQLKKYHDNLVLYTDSVSARTLIDELQLPYSSVYCELDELNKFDPGLWALPKIYAYSKQDEPFLHVDADVFIWKPFDKELLTGDLIVQNLEIATDYYENIMTSLEANLKFFPKEIRDDRKSNKKIYAFNAGILGGNDISLFKEYTTKAFDFVNRNTEYFHTIKVTEFNVFYEQYLLYCIAKNKNVTFLLPEIKGGNEYMGFGDFAEVPHNRQFLHLLGTFKQNKLVCEQLANRLRLDYPEYYYRIVALFKKRQFYLRKNYYHFINSTTEQDLVTRYSLLKVDFKNNKLPVVDINAPTRTFKPNYFRTGLAENAVDTIINENSTLGLTIDKLKICLDDVKVFENKIAVILDEKFSKYSCQYLYARDIMHTEYFKSIFENKQFGYNISIITDEIYEIIESQFDWSEVDFGSFGNMILMEQLSSLPSKYHTAVIPECDLTGFSLINIDELDLTILEILKKSSTINEVLNELKLAFDQADLEESEEEFELLVTGRIKMALMSKLIKVVQL